MSRRWAADDFVWRQLASEISARIADGTYALGSALPAENEPASGYAVARLTLRRALGELRKRKLITTRRRRGSTVVAMPGPGGLPS
jgi:DNA-binding GntR family transcriptional regulator